MHRPLIASDRCDRCGAQAFAVTQHGDDLFMWCAHHLRKHADVLVPLLVLDETAKLKEPVPA